MILTDHYHMTHNRLKVVSVGMSSGDHDGDEEAVSDLREITTHCYGISSMD